MKAFKFMSIVAGVMALAALAGCQQKVEDPYIKVVGDDVFEVAQNKTTLTVKIDSNRDWAVRMDAKASEWMVVEPSRGTASKNPVEVTLTVAENTGANRIAAIEFYTGVATAMVTVKQAGPKGDSDGIESLTVAEFISKADKTTYYRLTGTVSRFNSEYCSFDLTDESGTIYVYSVSESSKAEWTSKIKNGGTVTLQGQYEYYSSKNQHEVVNAIIESFTAGEEQTEITSSTVADFIAKANTSIYYRLTGTVSDFKTGKNNSGKDWMQFNLTDDTGSILVYGFQNGQFEEWSTKIKNNGTVVLVGTYEYYEQKSQHEVMNTKIESFTEGEAPQAVEVTVAEAIALQDNKPVIINESTVAGISTMGLIVTDGTANAYIYFDTKNGQAVPSVEIGDKVKVEGTKSSYNGIPEIVNATVTKSGTNTMSYPEPKDITSTAATYEAAVSEYVKLTGNLSISESNGNKYYNLTIPGVSAESKQGSLAGPLPAFNVDDMAGQDITVTGYVTGFASKGKYINILVTDVALADPDAKHCTVSPATLKAKADETSASFQIKANAAWTVTSDNDAFTVEPASGDADATVTVTFSANEGDSPRVANLTVLCADAGVETTVVLTQAKASSGEALTISLDFTTEISGFPQTSANGLQDGTYSLGGYDFKFHAADKFYQAKNSTTNLLYILIGKANSYIELPAIEGKALTKVKFLTGAGASENVIVDVAKTDNTRLNVNNDKLLKGKEYEWEITGEADLAYRLLIINSYNAQFQNLTLIYE